MLLLGRTIRQKRMFAGLDLAAMPKRTSLVCIEWKGGMNPADDVGRGRAAIDRAFGRQLRAAG